MIVSVIIPEAVKDRVINAIAVNFYYQATIGGLPNPVTKPQFAKARMIDWLKEQVKHAESVMVIDTARQAAIDNVDKTITIT